MNTTTPEVVKLNSLKDLKPLLTVDGPCLSVYMPLSPSAKQNALRWKECLRSLPAQGSPAEQELVQSIGDWQAIVGELGGEFQESAKSIAVFRSAELFHIALLDQVVSNRAVIGKRVQIRPLVAELGQHRNFYLLALSQKNTRILHCTTTTSEEVPFPADVQTDFEAWMNQAKPDHNAVNNGVTSGSQGSERPHALAPKGADQDAKAEYLSHFFKQINRGVNELLKGKSEPLVICAVEYEIPLYREVNSYAHIAKTDVHGAPNGLKSGEMHARALEALDRCSAMKLDDVLAAWNHRVGGGATSRVGEVVAASKEGRVLTLLVSDALDETASHGHDDAVNEAAVQTILHAGNVLLAPHDKLPGDSAMAAIYRY